MCNHYFVVAIAMVLVKKRRIENKTLHNLTLNLGEAPKFGKE